jgi:sodium-independent sulfate anion transporter 11
MSNTLQLAGPGTEYLLVSMDRALLFPSINHVRNLISKSALRLGRACVPVVVDCRHMFTADFTGAEGFSDMVADFRKRRQPILFTNLKASVEDTLLGCGDGSKIVMVDTPEELRQKLLGNSHEPTGGVAQY